MMVKYFAIILLMSLFSYIYLQTDNVMKTKSNGLKLSFKAEKSVWRKGEKMSVIVKIKNSSKSEIEFDLKTIRFQFSHVEGSFTKTFIVPSNEIKSDEFTFKIKSGKTVYQKFELSKLPFLEFDSTNSNRNFGEIPNGKYKLTILSESQIENNSSILIDVLDE